MVDASAGKKKKTGARMEVKGCQEARDLNDVEQPDRRTIGPLQSTSWMPKILGGLPLVMLK